MVMLVVVAAVLGISTAWLLYARTQPTRPTPPAEPLDLDKLRLMDEGREPREHLEDSP